MRINQGNIVMMAMTLKTQPRAGNGSNSGANARLFIDVDIICELTINRHFQANF